MKVENIYTLNNLYHGDDIMVTSIKDYINNKYIILLKDKGSVYYNYTLNIGNHNNISLDDITIVEPKCATGSIVYMVVSRKPISVEASTKLPLFIIDIDRNSHNINKVTIEIMQSGEKYLRAMDWDYNEDKDHVILRSVSSINNVNVVDFEESSQMYKLINGKVYYNKKNNDIDYISLDNRDDIVAVEVNGVKKLMKVKSRSKYNTMGSVDDTSRISFDNHYISISEMNEYKNDKLISTIVSYEEESDRNNMTELETIQKKENLNKIFSIGETGPGGANHEYIIKRVDTGKDLSTIEFQKGARKEENSIHGVIDSDLLEIVKHRLEAFQNGPFACKENGKALTHITLALEYMNDRVEDRIVRNTLGTYKK